MDGAGATSRRATLVVGYGDFGRAALERLLASTAPRGVLDWEEPRAGAGLGERTLRDLALLHVSDRLSRRDGAAEERTASSASGLLGDLYRQIQVVEPRASAAQDLQESVIEVAERLLSASGRAGRGDTLPLGLDLVVVAHPGEPEVLGLLDPMVAAALDALANNANLRRAVEGSAALTALAILDFESYWDGSEAGARLRRALAGSLAGWERRRAAGRASLQRVYLVDGRTADGIRDGRHRLDEISLFLELLLFEGQRGGELQRLWRPGGLPEPPLATFGVRLMERSAGLLRRLAAARFAVGWLEAMADDKVELEATGAAPASELETRLGPYRATELDRLLGGDDLEIALGIRLRSLEETLLGEWREAPEKTDELLRHAETATREIAAELARRTSARLEELDRGRFESLRQELAAAVSGELHHPRDPRPLGAVIRRLEDLALELAEPVEEAADHHGRAGDTATEPGRRLRALAARYLHFRSRKAAPEELRGWWPPWAAVLAAGATPILGRLVAEIPPPDGTRVLLSRAYAALQWLSAPPTLAVALFATLWLLGALVFQRRIVSLQRRGDALYLDPERGRLADALRAELGPEGGLGRPLHRELAAAVADRRQALRGAVRRELGRALERLRERRREMLWLHDELRDFLTLHGVDLGAAGPRLDRRQRDGTGIRFSVERAADLERVLEANPPTPARFRATQAELRPFSGWDQRHADAFLDPLSFLERLSRLYSPAAVEEPGAGAEPERDLLDFVRAHGRFDLAFAWPMQEGLPVDRRFALLPEAWRGRASVRSALGEQRIGAEATLAGPDAARAYLLRFQGGVPTACLEGER